MGMPDINPNNITWMDNLLHGCAQFSQTGGKIISGVLGSLAAFVDLYSFYKHYQDKALEQQRKMKLATYFSSFSLNAFYVAGVLARFASSLLLSAVCVGIDLITLTRVSYITHQARKAVAKTKQELKNITDIYEPANDNGRFLRASHESLTLRLQTEREYRLKNKIEVGFTVASAVTSCVFVGGLFFPPLLAVGFGLFIAVKAIQLIDSLIDNRISSGIGNLWNKIIGKKEVENSFSAPANTEKSADHTRSFAHIPVIQKREANIPVQDRHFNHRPHAMLASHTRFFNPQKSTATIKNNGVNPNSLLFNPQARMHDVLHHIPARAIGLKR
jgi:hypothetical protein